MKLDKIIASGRHRKDLGDLSDLTASIAKHGLLNRIMLAPDGTLIHGERRLAACRELGWTDVPVQFADSMPDAVAMLEMERDENTCRKDMTPSEKVALGKALTALERPKAAERQAEAGSRNLPNASSVPPYGTSAPLGETREIVAPAVGLSTASYSRAKQLVDAAEAGDPVAVEKVAEMDATGKISKPHQEWKDSQAAAQPNLGLKTAGAVADRWKKVAAMAAEGYSSRQIASTMSLHEDTVRRVCRDRGIEITADSVILRTRRIDSADVVRRIVEGLETTSTTMQLIDWEAVNPAMAEEWLSSLKESLKSLAGFRKHIEELSQL